MSGKEEYLKNIQILYSRIYSWLDGSGVRIRWESCHIIDGANRVYEAPHLFISDSDNHKIAYLRPVIGDAFRPEGRVDLIGNLDDHYLVQDSSAEKGGFPWYYLEDDKLVPLTREIFLELLYLVSDYKVTKEELMGSDKRELHLLNSIETEGGWLILEANKKCELTVRLFMNQGFPDAAKILAKGEKEIRSGYPTILPGGWGVVEVVQGDEWVGSTIQVELTSSWYTACLEIKERRDQGHRMLYYPEFIQTVWSVSKTHNGPDGSYLEREELFCSEEAAQAFRSIVHDHGPWSWGPVTKR